MATFCLLLALVGALTCWYGNRHDGEAAASLDRTLARIGKPAVPLALIGWVLTSGGLDRPGGHWLVAALAFALVGDLALLGTSSMAFLGGLGAFALAQLAFISAFVAVIGDHGFVWWMALLGVAFAGLFVATAGRRVQAGATAKEGAPFGYGVLGYMALLSATAAAAGGTGRWLALVGAVLFVVSDTVLGLDRFVAARAKAGLVVMTTYHLALAGLALGIAA